MGDYADDALDRAMDDCELFEELQRKGDIQSMFDNGFISEGGDVYIPVTLPDALRGTKPRQHHFNKPSGPGVCPICGAGTHPVTNKTTKAIFYGCDNYPDCKGSRNGIPLSVPSPETAKCIIRLHPDDFDGTTDQDDEDEEEGHNYEEEDYDD